MLIMSNPYSQKKLHTWKMLIMLIMPNPMGGLGDRAPWGLTLLTLLTFPLWGAKKGSHRRNVNNVNNVKIHFIEKCFWQGKC